VRPSSNIDIVTKTPEVFIAGTRNDSLSSVLM
jgi:hypothetical protein